MNTPKTKSLKIRPYARLLTMLGNQLIKNERIALIEIIKNSYDADASWVKVSFEGFGEHFEVLPTSKITIEDDGTGMRRSVIEKHWVNPATPEKKMRKSAKPTTKKGRFLQGEKGIGRFAILKLGKTVKIITKPAGKANEHVINYDFASYNEDFIVKKKNKENDEITETPLFLDDLEVVVSSRKANYFTSRTVSVGGRKIKAERHGTKIEISNLEGKWTKGKVENAYKEIAKLQDLFASFLNDDSNKEKSPKDDFFVGFHVNGEPESYHDIYSEKLKVLVHERSVLKVTKGRYDESKKELRFHLNSKPVVISLLDPHMKSLRVYKDYFLKNGLSLSDRKTECGDFGFQFFVFDFAKQAPPKYLLDKTDRDLIRPHRTYLYRDGIRVYPYGEPFDDWLHVDQHRGTIAAGDFLSNDQVIGLVEITHEHNSKLRDKTNREGLIEEGNAAGDFVAILQSLLMYLRKKSFHQYQIDLKKKSEAQLVASNQIEMEFEALSEAITDGKKSDAKKFFTQLQKHYKVEKKYLTERAERTEDLAGIGLSVEAASHDISSFLVKALSNIDALIREFQYGDIDPINFEKDLHSLRGMLGFVNDQLHDVQLLFRSTKQRRKSIRVEDLLTKVERIYTRIFKKAEIKLSIKKVGRSPLVVRSTDAVLLQLLINLFDNAVFWLEQSDQEKKQIVIELNGKNGTLICSDNGPGIREDDLPYIFEPFYSGKGEEGRGLGLYIARQLLMRHGYGIEYIREEKEKLLSGANFMIDFVEGR